MGYLRDKLIDLVLDWGLRHASTIFKSISPVKISPSLIPANTASGWGDIRIIEVTNRLNSNIYNIFLEGLSEDTFDIKPISDNSPKEKTVEVMNINTNHVNVIARDSGTGKVVWLFRIQKLGPREQLSLRTKVSASRPILLSVLEYSYEETPVRESSDGAVQVPFKLKKYPRIRA
jgi:hypothetical protein